MAWIGTAIVTAIVAGPTLVQRNQNKKAQKRAERAAVRDRKNARKAEVFANTEGQAIGDLGVVDLSLDDDITEEARLKQMGRATSTLSI